MSYARNNGVDSNVYVIGSKCGGFRCYHSLEGKMASVVDSFETRTKLWDHLLDHLEVGDMVPVRTWTRLSNEMAAE